MLTAIKNWWNKPWAKQRVLNVLAKHPAYWRQGLDIWTDAGVSVGYFYILMSQLEKQHIVESKPDDQLPKHIRQGYGIRLFRLRQPEETQI